jgi:hypothetical protein
LEFEDNIELYPGNVRFNERGILKEANELLKSNETSSTLMAAFASLGSAPDSLKTTKVNGP